MSKVFCLMGKSSSGKDTIFKMLSEDADLNLKPVISYTTRPKRTNETNGIEYYFINEAILGKYSKLGKIIEKREYNTVNGKWYYCTMDDGQIDLTKDNYLLIVTLEEYGNLQNYFGNENIVPIYIQIKEDTRLERALKREKQQQYPNYDELCRRFLADNNDFHVEKLNFYGIKKYYDNYDLHSCVNSIKQDILKLIS